ncbi:MAG TPA: rhodanese-like domain-containing protein [Saprospiraceae bacterium]|nr:rhodanese-like domain-containing protein [Saprospiraceae bacterium]
MKILILFQPPRFRYLSAMKMYRFTLILLCFIGMISCSSGQYAGVKNLSAKAFDQTIKEQPEKVILDVRTPEEYAEGHLAGALNVNWEGDHFDQQVAGLDKSKPVMVYCAAGGRSAAASKHLAKKGFKQVFNLEDGMEDWAQKGYPVTKQ